ncbi:hypothetical protein MXB_1610, partial [Myxobolus squamalis]
IYFYLLHVAISDPENEIEVVLEEIDSCDLELKLCKFPIEHYISTMAGILKNSMVKLQDHEFHFVDETTGDSFIYDNYFCSVPGLPDFKFLTEDLEIVPGLFYLKSDFS